MGKSNKNNYNNNNNNNNNSNKSNSAVKYFDRVSGLNANAAKVSFYNPVGLPADIAPYVTRVPGIMVIGTVFGPGFSDGPNSAVNVAAKGIVAYLTSNIGRPYSYDPQDYMQYILSFESIYSLLVSFSTVIGLCTTVSGENRYIPQALIEALGYDSVNITGNLPRARWIFNYYANQLKKLNVPTSFTNFNWHRFLLSNIYRDSSNLKAQLYAFRLEGVHQYDEASGSCKFLALDDGITLDSIEALLRNLINPLLTSQNIGNMSSDTKKAFGDKIMTLPEIPEGYTTPIIHDAEMLNFIHNLTITGSITSTPGATLSVLRESLSITQDPETSSLIWKPIVASTSQDILTKFQKHVQYTHVLDVPSDNPTDSEVLFYTRGKADVLSVSQAQGYMKPGTCELFTTCKIICNPDGSKIESFTGDYEKANFNTFVTVISMFDWAPRISFSPVAGPSTIAQLSVWEIRNYTVLNSDILDRINEGALASIYNIPQIGVVK